MASVFSYLETCVETEAQDLVEQELKTTERQRVTKKLENECLADARETFVEEISGVLSNPEATPLHHWSVIGYRRKPAVWAIAAAIREQLKAEE
jgi:tRNA A37 N6-isopentenylltransferase MiaA